MGSVRIAAMRQPPLAGLAPPPAKNPSLLRQFRAAKGNPFETLPLASFEELIHAPASAFGRMLMVHDPEGIRHVLMENVANYPKHEQERQFLCAMFGEGLLSAEGEIWRRHRKVMAPSFDPRSIAAYVPPMADAAQAFVRRWRDLAEGAVVNIAAEMQALTLEIVCRTMFSSDAEELAGLAGPALASAQEALSFTPLDMMPVIGPMRMRAKQKVIRERFSIMDAAIHRMIGSREKHLAQAPDAAPKDLLTRLIGARDPDDGAGLSPAEVRDEVVTIFMAGHETTAVSTTWVWYLLSHFPEVEESLHAELGRVLGGRAPAGPDLAHLQYTRMVLEETMRLYPPAPALSLRVALKDDEICGVKAPAGTRILISPWVLHRHRRLWDDPERFDPDRFSAGQSANRPRFAFLPFGGGPRVCIGAALAMTEATLIIASLAQHYRPRLVEGQSIGLQARITLRPRGGIRMRLEGR